MSAETLTGAVNCAACGALAQGNASIHRDGFDEGPEVELCDGCGLEPVPTCEQLWDAIAARKVVSIESALPPIKAAPVIGLPNAPDTRVTLRARPPELGGAKVIVCRGRGQATRAMSRIAALEQTIDAAVEALADALVCGVANPAEPNIKNAIFALRAARSKP